MFGIRQQGLWFRTGHPEDEWVQKERRTLFESRALAYFWAARILEANPFPGLRVVRVVRKEKAVSKDEWSGGPVDAVAGEYGFRPQKGHRFEESTLRAWLERNVGKRVRITLEVLP